MQSQIFIMQHNTARNSNNMQTCLEIGLKRNIDFILFQEPWIAPNDNRTIQHSAYTTILPKINNLRPRTAIFANKNSKFGFCPRTDITDDSDVIILDILNSEIPELQITNIYNKRSLAKNNYEYIIK